MANEIVLTGIKPTGMPHLGNYLYALKPAIERSKIYKTYMFVADLHSLNTIHNPAEIRQHTYEIVALMLALGLDMNNAVLFRQSDITEIYQLTELLMNVTPKGLMNRAHSYKAAVDKNTVAGTDADAGINMGLYTYPILMAADILLYNSDFVPVGADQKQHVEFARDIAGYFNHIYGETLKLPEPIIQDGGVLLGLDGRKMSKSYDNTIPVFAPENELKKKIMRIITDSKTPEEPKDAETSTIFNLYKHFATDEEIAEFRNRFTAGGMGYGTAKMILFDKINSVLSDARNEYNRLLLNPGEIDAILADGARKARVVAEQMFARVKRAMLG